MWRWKAEEEPLRAVAYSHDRTVHDAERLAWLCQNSCEYAILCALLANTPQYAWSVKPYSAPQGNSHPLAAKPARHVSRETPPAGEELR